MRSSLLLFDCVEILTLVGQRWLADGRSLVTNSQLFTNFVLRKATQLDFSTTATSAAPSRLPAAQSAGSPPARWPRPSTAALLSDAPIADAHSPPCRCSTCRRNRSGPSPTPRGSRSPTTATPCTTGSGTV